MEEITTTNNRRTAPRMNVYFRAFKALFGDKKFTESFWENRIEADWEEKYKEISKINFTEIFANRLTNYTLNGSAVSVDDAVLNEELQKCYDKAYKWMQMAYGVGRVFLVPYTIAGNVYTDIIPQGHAFVTNRIGDDVTGIGVVADERTINNKRYTRLTDMEYDAQARTFSIRNKAINAQGQEISLTSVPEWADIDAEILVSNVEKPLFSYVDCPKDNRSSDNMQGASITFGCESTIAEIYELLQQYRDEYSMKETWLGVDRVMIGKDGKEDTHLFKKFDGKSTDDFFQIFSPDIRSQAYKDRMLELFARLEKQVGTSAGILTPAETANATATQVRRSMFDTLSMISRAQRSIEKAIDELLYIYGVYNSLIGKPSAKEFSVSVKWGNTLTDDAQERFNALMQAQASGAISKAEVRQFLFPNETPQEAEEIVKQIEADAPQTQFADMLGM